MGIFGKKKRKMVDFTKMSDARMPIINKDYKLEGDAVDLREKRIASSQTASKREVANPFSGVSSSPSSNNEGMFGFLESSNDSSTTSYPSRNVMTEVSEISELKKNMRKISSQIEDHGNEVYRLMQRIELLEKKIGRLEGRG